MCDITNETFALGEKFTKEKLVWKAKGIAFQAKGHTEEMKLACDHDDDPTEVVVKIIKRLNKSCPSSINSYSISAGVSTPRRNTPSNVRNFEEGSRKRFNAGNNSESIIKNKGIQCSECVGFMHIQAECANTLKKKKKTSMLRRVMEILIVVMMMNLIFLLLHPNLIIQVLQKLEVHLVSFLVSQVVFQQSSLKAAMMKI